MSLQTRAAQGIPGHIIIHIAGLPHCPRNRSHVAHVIRKGKGKPIASIMRTEAARAYEAALIHHLMKYRAFADGFKKAFNSETQHLVATWEFTSPGVYTKAGKVSENGTDLDAHKVLQDTIMGFIGIDDAYIVKDTRTKLEGDFHISLELIIKDNTSPDGSHLL